MRVDMQRTHEYTPFIFYRIIVFIMSFIHSAPIIIPLLHFFLPFCFLYNSIEHSL